MAASAASSGTPSASSGAGSAMSAAPSLPSLPSDFGPFWRDFDVDGQRRVAERERSEVAAREAAARQSRSAITEVLRALKVASEPAEKETQSASAVSMFKKEVDELTRRARAAEKAHAELLERLGAAPNPLVAVAVVEDLQRRVTELVREGEALEADKKAYVLELSQLENQSVTVRELERKLAELEARVEDEVEERASERERLLRVVFDEELATLRESEEEAEHKVRLAQETSLQNQRAAERAQSELFDLRTRHAEESRAREMQLQVLGAEVEKRDADIAQLRQEVARLRRQLHLDSKSTGTEQGEADAELGGTGLLVGTSSSSSSSTSSSSSSSASLPSSPTSGRLLARLDELETELQQSRAALEAARRSTDESARHWGEVVSEREATIATLREELAGAPKVAELDALRQELQLVRSIYLADSDVPSDGGDGAAESGTDGVPTDANPSSSSSSSTSSTSSSSLPSSSTFAGAASVSESKAPASLVRRTRTLESSVVRLRRRVEDLEAESQRLRDALVIAQDTVEDQRSLIRRLELEVSAEGGARPLALRGPVVEVGADTRSDARRAASSAAAVSSRGVSHLASGTVDMSAEAQLSSLLGSTSLTSSILGSATASHTSTSASASGLASASSSSSPSPLLPLPSLASALSPIESSSTARAPTSSPGTETGMGAPQDPTTLTDILRGQRDRFRARVMELESSLAAAQASTGEAEARADRLEQDNLRLYERVLALQSGAAVGLGGLAGRGRGRPFSPATAIEDEPWGDEDDGSSARKDVEGGRGGGAVLRSTASSSASSASSSSSASSASDELMARYGALFDQRTNPFAAFGRSETDRRLSRLPMVDRVAHTCAWAMSRSPQVRVVLVFYAILLHFLIFASLWLYTHRAHDDCSDHFGGAGGGR